MAQNSVTSEPTFASLDTLGPCMIKFGVTGISAVVEPSTTVATTTKCTRFLDSNALGTLRSAADNR